MNDVVADERRMCRVLRDGELRLRNERQRMTGTSKIDNRDEVPGWIRNLFGSWFFGAVVFASRHGSRLNRG